MVALLLVAFVAVASAQYHESCSSDAECQGFCEAGTCRPWVQEHKFCSKTLRCRYDLRCSADTNRCVRNTCQYDHQCYNGYCNNDFGICVQFAERGESCNDVTVCGDDLKCEGSVCVNAVHKCSSNEDCDSSQYCDAGPRKCFTKVCDYDSDCSDRYYCSEENGMCTVRPVDGEVCGGEPFVPCDFYLRCEDGACLNPASKLPCVELDSCEDCHHYASDRCTWSDGTCSACGDDCEDTIEMCEGEEWSLGEDNVLNLPAGQKFDAKYDSCTRDLDCAIGSFCHGGDPRFKGTGMCALLAEEGEACGGAIEMKCAPPFSCVVDGHHKEQGICVVNGAKNIVKRRVNWPGMETVVEETVVAGTVPRFVVPPASPVAVHVSDGLSFTHGVGAHSPYGVRYVHRPGLYSPPAGPLHMPSGPAYATVYGPAAAGPLHMPAGAASARSRSFYG